MLSMVTRAVAGSPAATHASPGRRKSFKQFRPSGSGWWAFYRIYVRIYCRMGTGGVVGLSIAIEALASGMGLSTASRHFLGLVSRA